MKSEETKIEGVWDLLRQKAHDGLTIRELLEVASQLPTPLLDRKINAWFLAPLRLDLSFDEVIRRVKRSLGTGPKTMITLKKGTGLPAKTIQRAINQLVAAGDVSFKGDRRSRTYHLVGGGEGEKK